MSSISQNAEVEQQLDGTISNFISEYNLRKLLLSCNAGKEKGVPIMKVFRYLLCIVFAARRRKQSRRKATDVMLELLQDAIKSGHQAKYVLFDSWSFFTESNYFYQEAVSS